MNINNIKFKNNLKILIIFLFANVLILTLFRNTSLAATGVNISGKTYLQYDSEISTIEISTADELWKLAKESRDYTGVTIKLTKDIDLGCNKNKPWPILNKEYYFNGIFDGNNHTIKNIYILVNGTDSFNSIGFFGTLYENAIIKNTTFQNCIIEKNNQTSYDELDIGIIAGSNEGIISNCKITDSRITINNCNVKYHAYIGGIVGRSSFNGIIDNCSSKTTINITSGKKINGDLSWGSLPVYTGGIIGLSEGQITNCTNKGEITTKLGDAGGIAGGYFGNKITNCKNHGKVNVYSRKDIVVFGGGIVGELGISDKASSIIISGCGNNASIKGYGYKESGNDKKSGVYLGGLLGSLGTSGLTNSYPQFTINNCYSIGNISLDGKYSKVKDSYKYNGFERRKGYGLGGVIGFTMMEGLDSVTISNFYSVGTIQNTGYAGSIFGRLNTDYYSTVKIYTSNIYHTSSLKDKGNENEKYGYVSPSTHLGKDRYIKSIKTNSTTRTWASMKKNDLVSKLNKNGNIFAFDKYGINGGYPYIKQLENGWKTANKKTYYFTKGVAATGLKTINGKQYYFDQNGVLDKIPPKISVKYSTKNTTNKDITVTLTANEKIKNISGWTLSKDQKKLTRVYKENMKCNITVYDLTRNSTSVNLKISNIDKTLPKVSVEYSNKNATNKNVTVTLTANEKIKNTSGWNLSKDSKKLTKTFTTNTNHNINVYDLAGNKTTVNIKINNIDKTAPQITGVINQKAYFNKLTPLINDEHLSKVELIRDGNTVTTYSNGTEITEVGKYKLTATDEAGNVTKVEFELEKLPDGKDGITYNIEPYTATNQSVKVTFSKTDSTKYENLKIQVSLDGENYEETNEKIMEQNGKIYARYVIDDLVGEALEVEINNIGQLY